MCNYSTSFYLVTYFNKISGIGMFFQLTIFSYPDNSFSILTPSHSLLL